MIKYMESVFFHKTMGKIPPTQSLWNSSDAFRKDHSPPVSTLEASGTRSQKRTVLSPNEK